MCCCFKIYFCSRLEHELGEWSERSGIKVGTTPTISDPEMTQGPSELPQTVSDECTDWNSSNELERPEVKRIIIFSISLP